MKKKVLVYQIQPASWKNLLPLSAALLVSYSRGIPRLAQEYDFEIMIRRENLSENFQPEMDAGILAFSTYSWNFRHSLKLAELHKTCDPTKLTIFGGPMMPSAPERIKELLVRYPFIDVVVTGMGEWTFGDILLARLDGKSLEDIAGVSFRILDGNVFCNPPNYQRSLDELPSPFLDGTCDDLIMKYGSLITGVLWETDRGCPYNCAYCVQGNADFSKILIFDKERLFRELEWISRNRVDYVFCADANFGILPRDVEIAERIAQTSKTTGCPKFFLVPWLKSSSGKIMRVLEILNSGGVYSRLTLSMQSFNPDTLEAVSRKNLSFKDFTDIKEEAGKKGITTYTEMILGLPGETYQSFLDGLRICMDKRLKHFFTVYICRLLENTRMASPDYVKKHKLDTRTIAVGLGRHVALDSGERETEDVIVSTSTLSVEEWKQAFLMSSAVLALYNFRLAFFVCNYLRQDYGIDLIYLIGYIVDWAQKNRNTFLGKAVEIIVNGRQAILGGNSDVVSLDFTGKMVYEIPEAAMILLLYNKTSYCLELRQAVDEYLRSLDIVADGQILDEVFIYQQFRIPVWNHKAADRQRFRFNVPQYFQALCVDGEPVMIEEKDVCLDAVGNSTVCESFADFVRSRLTFATFEILDVTIVPAGIQKGS